MEAISTVHQNGTILADDLKKRDTTDYAMTVDKLSKRYGYHEAVKDVSFNVKLGEVRRYLTISCDRTSIKQFFIVSFVFSVLDC